MTDLGLDQLTPDQLVELLRAVCQEGARRSIGTQAAMQDVILSEAEAARIARAAADEELRRIRLQREREIAEDAAAKVRAAHDPQAKTGAKATQERADLAAAIRPHWQDAWERLYVTVWSRDNDKRVYLRANDAYSHLGVCVQITDTSRRAAGEVQYLGGKSYKDCGADWSALLLPLGQRWSNLKLEIARAQ